MSEQVSDGQRDDWNQHWSRYEGATQLNPAQSYRRRLIIQLMGQAAPLRGARVLDIGSGQGDFAAEVAPFLGDGTLVGVELSEAGVRLSRAKTPQFAFFTRDLSLPVVLPPEYLSWATHAVCSEVLEHSDNPDRILQGTKPLLRDDGTLIVTVPGGPMSTFDRHIGHRRHYTPETLEHLLRQSGYHVVRILRAGFPFFNVYRLVVILKGRGLIRELSSQESGQGASPLARAAMRAFDQLFWFNRTDTPLGWQLIAIARKSTTAAASVPARGPS